MILGSTTKSLSTTYDLAMLDLDGVVYRGADAIPGVADALGVARGKGLRLAYITNNASRTADAVVHKLQSMGMPDVREDDVVTSAQAVAHLMADALPSGAAVLVVGGEGLRVALEARGLRPVASLDDSPVAVVQGFHGDIGWHDLAEASYAIQGGLPWYASNTDLTVPTARGIAPGNGSLVQAVRFATGAEPIVAGKPERALLDETIARVGGTHPLMVGDRLDTDIDGAINAGIDSLVVLTGVSSLREVVAAAPGHRPTYVSADLRGLDEEHPEVVVDGDRARCGSASAVVSDGVVTIDQGDRSSTTALRALVELAWTVADRSDTEVTLDGTLDA
ncbi:HAD-IIA family hydrolase [Aeromicrobium wangtongii]|uniref:HAD-IIA family hydrolase n=1 Tax=Aeromicrobium wangtongii TaxID=2969247 RepID=A0ABY5M3D4_9ACTN|nr:HAD-IIA family hydrolase [Aeromicrobium wangtongii]MCD9198681.1 HAD-IIA family hydrolase [Aeromicrobium wangtongii]UUP12705.1 HAD-IIA family hydrolase [Aeromicrobium wangtongii]